MYQVLPKTSINEDVSYRFLIPRLYRILSEPEVSAELPSLELLGIEYRPDYMIGIYRALHISISIYGTESETISFPHTKGTYVSALYITSSTVYHLYLRTVSFNFNLMNFEKNHTPCSDYTGIIYFGEALL